MTSSSPYQGIGCSEAKLFGPSKFYVGNHSFVFREVYKTVFDINNE
jgi:hypothetical protein